MSHELPRIDLAGSSVPLTRERITGTHLHQFYGCSHATYLEFTHDRALQVPHTEAVKKLLERGRRYEEEVVAALDVVEPAYEPGDWDAAHAATLELMREGHPWIFQAVLHDPPYLGIADLLRRIERPSRLGDHAYEVLDVKSSRKARLEQMLQVTFYSFLLAKEQGLLPEEGALILADHREERFLIDDVQWTLLDLLDEMGELLRGDRPSTPHRKASCDGCPWRAACLPEMEERRHVSLLPSVSRSRARRLARRGITSLTDLERSDVETLARERLLSRNALQGLVLDAHSYLRGQIGWREGARALPLEWPLTFLQIERDSFRDEALCLLAWTTLDEELDRRHRAFLVRDEEDERTALGAWFERLDSREPPRTVVFGSRALELLERRAKHFSLPIPDGLEPLDLRALVRDAVSVPVPGDSLYAMGLYFGTHEPIEGGPALSLWWETHRQEGDAAHKDLVTLHVERNAETAHLLLRLLQKGPGGLP